MKIEARTVTEYIYTSEDGREQKVTEMANKHLLNAMLKAEREDEDRVVDILRAEALSRMIGAGEA